MVFSKCTCLVVDRLKDSMHPTVGDEHFRGWVGQDGLLRHPGQNQDILRNGKLRAASISSVVILDVILENHSLGQSLKCRQEVRDHLLWNSSGVKNEAHCEQDYSILGA